MYDGMRSKRLIFKRPFQNCKKDEQKIHDSQFLSNAKRNLMSSFSREVKSRRHNAAVPADMIDGICSGSDRDYLFAEEFGSITATDINATTDTNATESIYCSTGLNKRPTVISVHDLREAISKLKPGVGLNGIHANHLKFLKDKLLAFIAMFFSIGLDCVYFLSKF